MRLSAPRLAAAVLIMLAGIWAGARVYSTRNVVRSSGRASPAVADAGEDAVPAPKIPDRLPVFSLMDIKGRDTPISAWSGKSLVINFWATWCAPCRHEIPLLQALNVEWAGRGVEVVGIAVDRREKVLEFAGELKIAYPLLIGEQDALDAAAAFGMASPVFPFTVFTDRRGEVVALFVGELHKPEADLILSTVQSLNHDQVRLPEARRNIEKGLHQMGDRQPG